MNLLSIRGGGCRGLLVTKILVYIEHITQKPIYELFDFYGGSSVGVLITAGILVSEMASNHYIQLKNYIIYF